MKKSLLILAGLALIASSALGQQVLSRNAVGYTRVMVPSNGGLQMASTAFEPISASDNLFTNALGSQLPVGSRVYFWDITNQMWQTTTKGVKGWDGVGSVKELKRGESFFVTQPESVVTNLYVYLMGEVPDSFSAPTSEVVMAGGGALCAAAFSYPVAMLWTNTVLSAALSNNDSVIFWDSSSGIWQTSTKGLKGWDGVGSVKEMQPGEGFFIRKNSLGSYTWSETKPYTWP